MQHGKTEEAIRNLRLVHRINNLHRSKVNFPIKTVHVEAVHADDGGVAKGVVTGSIARRWARFRGHVKQVCLCVSKYLVRFLSTRSLVPIAPHIIYIIV